VKFSALPAERPDEKVWMILPGFASGPKLRKTAEISAVFPQRAQQAREGRTDILSKDLHQQRTKSTPTTTTTTREEETF
jgi:hypothetical protein